MKEKIDYEKLITNLAAGKYFRVYNSLIQYFEDFPTAAFLSKLIYKYQGCKIENSLVDGKWFYYTRVDIQQDFFFSEYVQRGIIKTLEDSKVLETYIFPNMIPQKKYYAINFERLAEILSV